MTKITIQLVAYAFLASLMFGLASMVALGSGGSSTYAKGFQVQHLGKQWRV